MRSLRVAVVACVLALNLACGVDPVDLEPGTEVPVTPGEVSGPPGAQVAPGVPLSAVRWGPQGTIIIGRWGSPAAAAAAGLSSCEVERCEELEAALRTRLIQRARHEAESMLLSALRSKQYASGWTGGFSDAGAFGGTGGTAGSGGSGGSVGNGSAGAAGGPNDYTTTNTQHVDVDEGDIVKNDGTRLFVVSGRRLSIMRSWPAAELSEVSHVLFDFTPKELFLRGGQVLVLGSESAYSYGPYFYAYGDTRAQLLDVSTLSAPRTVARWSLPGRLESSRRHGGLVRVVTESTTPYTYSVLNGLGLQTWVPYDVVRASTDAQLVALCWDIALRAEVLIRSRKVSELFPTTQRFNGQAALAPQSRMFLPAGEVAFGKTVVATIDLDAPGPAALDLLLARTEQLYASSHSLYLTTYQWDWSGASASPSTQLHKLELSGAGVKYAGSGEVQGTIHNQFSLDEHQDVLRVAHTAWTRSPSFTTQNFVSTLSVRDGRLVTVGRTDPLAPGERIMSARFVGDVGYVVTFRQTDPLYTVDLSNPARPRVVGELHIPGFSSYIHPIDPTHLLTIGTYVNPPGTSFARAVQLALFDVSDLANPRQTHVQLLGGASSSSTAQWDHHAFTYFAARKTVAIPFSTWEQGQYTSDLRVFTVDPVTGFTNKGALAVDDLLKRGSCEWSSWNGSCWTWWWQPSVRRSVMADEFVYGISSGGVRVATVDALHQPFATVAFPQAY